MSALFGQRGVNQKVSDEDLMAAYMNSGWFTAVAKVANYSDHHHVRRRLEDYLMLDFVRLFEQMGIPRYCQQRRDMLILHEDLAVALRRVILRRYGVRPGIVEGDTIAEAIRKGLEAIGEEARHLCAVADLRRQQLKQTSS